MRFRLQLITVGGDGSERTHSRTGSTSLVQHRHCAICSKALSQKGHQQIKLQTVFGNLQIRSPRLRCCP
jgi:hypothetical protein